MMDIERLSSTQRAELFKQVDHQIKMGEAKPGQRQRALVLARFEINEAETGWKYPTYESLLPIVYADRYYPEGTTYLLWQARQSLKTFARSLELGRKHAVNIADEIREQRESYSSLSDKEIIDVVFANIGFEEFAERTRIHEE